MTRVAVFTDNDFGKINGVTTTLKALVRYAPEDVRPRIYTLSDFGSDETDYLALRSLGLPIPFYSEMAIYFPRLRAFRRHLEADGVRLLHLTTPGPAGLAARYLMRRSGACGVGSFHTYLAEYTQLLTGCATLAASMRSYLRWVYRDCERVMVPSEDARRRLTADGWPAERLSLWTRGVDVATFAPHRRSAALRERWEVDDGRLTLLYAGRVSHEKGLDLLAPVVSRLTRDRIPHRLVIVGDGPMMPALRQACPDARFTGHLAHDEVAVAMASADVFVFPSATDTAGNVVLEAQASGLPVVVSNEGGPRENMQHAASGFVCEAGDAVDFANRVTALADPELRACMGTAARAYAQQRSWESALAPVYSLYRGVLALRHEPDTVSPATGRNTAPVALP